MRVSRRMQTKIFTIQKSDTVEKAQTMMAVNNIRHLPVLEKSRLVGIISDRDIRGVLIPQRSGKEGGGKGAFYLPRDVKVDEAMTPEPLFVEPGSDIEEAARLLYMNKIGCLPVMEKNKVVGIITDYDILWVFSEIMGVLESSCRLDVTIGDDPDGFEKVTEIILKHKGKIISVGMLPIKGKKKNVYSYRLKNCETKAIIAGLKEAGYKVRDEVG